MKGEWKSINFELIDFKDSKCPVLKLLDPINDKLDEDVTKIMGILSSPFIKFLEKYLFIIIIIINYDSDV